MEPARSASAQLRLGQGAFAGVTEEMIQALVQGFYAKVRVDPELAPIFDRAIRPEHWRAHLTRMCDFWSSTLLMTGRFEGAPLPAHIRIPDIRPAHFDRWLDLFRQTACEVCPPEAAAVFISRAETITESLQLGVAASRGEPAMGRD